MRSTKPWRGGGPSGRTRAGSSSQDDAPASLDDHESPGDSDTRAVPPPAHRLSPRNSNFFACLATDAPAQAPPSRSSPMGVRTRSSSRGGSQAASQDGPAGSHPAAPPQSPAAPDLAISAISNSSAADRDGRADAPPPSSDATARHPGEPPAPVSELGSLSGAASAPRLAAAADSPPRTKTHQRSAPAAAVCTVTVGDAPVPPVRPLALQFRDHLTALAVAEAPPPDSLSLVSVPVLMASSSSAAAALPLLVHDPDQCAGCDALGRNKCGHCLVASCSFSSIDPIEWWRHLRTHDVGELDAVALRARCRSAALCPHCNMWWARAGAHVARCARRPGSSVVADPSVVPPPTSPQPAAATPTSSSPPSCSALGAAASPLLTGGQAADSEVPLLSSSSPLDDAEPLPPPHELMHLMPALRPFTLHPVPGDGACLLHSLVAAGVQHTLDDLRVAAVSAAIPFLLARPLSAEADAAVRALYSDPEVRRHMALLLTRADRAAYGIAPARWGALDDDAASLEQLSCFANDYVTYIGDDQGFLTAYELPALSAHTLHRIHVHSVSRDAHGTLHLSEQVFGEVAGEVVQGVVLPHIDPSRTIHLLHAGNHFDLLLPHPPAAGHAGGAGARRTAPADAQARQRQPAARSQPRGDTVARGASAVGGAGAMVSADHRAGALAGPDVAPPLGPAPLQCLPHLVALLATVPEDRLHLPHCASPTIVALHTGGGTSRSFLLRWLRALRQVFHVISVAIGHEQAVSSMSAPGLPPSLPYRSALALRTLMPALLLQRPVSSGRSMSRHLHERFTLWEHGRWDELFCLADLRDAAGHWHLGEPAWRSVSVHDRAPAARGPDGGGGHLARDTTATEASYERAYRHATVNQLGRAMQSLTPAARIDPFDVPDELQRLHPQPARPTTPVADLATDPRFVHVRAVIAERVTSAVVSFIIRATPRFSQPGPDEFRYEHLKTMTTNDPSLADEADAALEDYTAYIVTCIQGALPLWYRSVFATAASSLLAKSSGGVRPLGAGNIDRRIAWRVAVHVFASEIADALPREQVGVSVSSGAEGAVLVVRQALALGWHFLGQDTRNAFNEIRRQRILDTVETEVDVIAPLTLYTYSGPVELTARSPADPRRFMRVMSSEGTHQGCPGGSALFSLGDKRAVVALRDHLDAVAVAHSLPTPAVDHPSLQRPYFFVCFIDDKDILGPPPIIRAAERAIAVISWHCSGTEINFAKTFIFPPLPPPSVEELAVPPVHLHLEGPPCFSVEERPPPAAVTGAVPLPSVSVEAGVQVLARRIDEREGAEALGVTVGSDDWQRRGVQRRFDAVVALFPIIIAFARADPRYLQVALLLMTQCVFSRVTFILRTSLPSHTQAPARAFDDAYRATLATITGLSPTDLAPTTLSGRVATLPARMGGCGWRGAAQILDAAYVGGFLAAARVAARITSLDGRLVRPDLRAVAFADAFECTRAIARLQLATRRDPDLLPSESAASPSASAPVDPALAVGSRVAGWVASALSGRAPDSDTDGGRPSTTLRFQHLATAALDRIARRLIEQDMTASQRDHLEAASMRGAREWLSALPLDAGLVLAGVYIRLALRRRLALPVFATHFDGAACPLTASSCRARGHRCSGRIDVMGRHAMVCPFNLGQARHDTFVNVLVAAAVDVPGVHVRPADASDELVPGAADSDSGDSERQCLPDLVIQSGLLSMPPSEVSTCNIDVSVVHCESQPPGRDWNSSSDSVLSRMRARVRDKNRKHSAPAVALGRSFVPFVLHGLGGLGDDALGLLHRFRDSYAEASPDPSAASLYMGYWVARFAVHAQIVTSQSLRRSVYPSQAGADARVGIPHMPGRRSDFREHCSAMVTSRAGARAHARRSHHTQRRARVGTFGARVGT